MRLPASRRGRRGCQPFVTARAPERKALTAERADAVVALPGGVGTPEEIFEGWSWRQLGFHAKPIGFLDAEASGRRCSAPCATSPTLASSPHPLWTTRRCPRSGPTSAGVGSGP
ncbi:LOG family protein [Streptomyces sp. NPDC002767]